MHGLLGLTGVLLAWFLGGGAFAAEPVSLTFGIVPQQAATKLAEAWTPVLRHLEERSGSRLLFRTAPDIPAFEGRLANGEFDIAYMNPYHYTVFHLSPGYRAFAREKDRRIEGILVVPKDSPIRSIRELDGRTLIFPAPAAFAASVLPRVALARENVSFVAKFVASHDSVYRAVASGLYPAGGGIVRTLDTVEPEIRDRLRILWRTGPYTPHAFAAHPRVPGEVVERLRRAMEAMDKEPAGRELLTVLAFKGIEEARDSDWDDVRGLGIEVLDRLIGEQ